jgi:hypothetical protein
VRVSRQCEEGQVRAIPFNAENGGKKNKTMRILQAMFKQRKSKMKALMCRMSWNEAILKNRGQLQGIVITDWALMK